MTPGRTTLNRGYSICATGRCTNGAVSVETTGCSGVWYHARFGSGKSQVQILLPRPRRPPRRELAPGRSSASGCSSVGRAPGLGPGGRRFEPCYPHQPLARSRRSRACRVMVTLPILTRRMGVRFSSGARSTTLARSRGPNILRWFNRQKRPAVTREMEVRVLLPGLQRPTRADNNWSWV